MSASLGRHVCKGAVVSLAVGALYAPHAAAQGPFDQAFYLYLGNNPRDVERQWTPECQGITHDDTHWYITQRDAIWRVPVSVDFSNLTTATPGVTGIILPDVHELAPEGYDHFGDPSRYLDYLLVPIEAGTGPNRIAGLAIFRADATVAYVDHCTITSPLINPAQDHAGWFGVDDEGVTYSSNSEYITEIYRYAVDWTALAQGGPLALTPLSSITPRDESGSPIILNALQGGVFTDDGERLYLVSQVAYFVNGVGWFSESWGIQVFDTNNWRRVRHSIRSSNPGDGPFRYEFNASLSHEPEGITVWDLEQLSSPYSGQLHAIVLNNDLDGLDNVWVKHYTHTLCVDPTAAGSQYGTPAEPYHSVNAALNAAWEGATLKIRAGQYAGSMTISQQVRLTADGGVVRFGH